MFTKVLILFGQAILTVFDTLAAPFLKAKIVGIIAPQSATLLRSPGPGQSLRIFKDIPLVIDSEGSEFRLYSRKKDFERDCAILRDRSRLTQRN